MRHRAMRPPPQRRDCDVMAGHVRARASTYDGRVPELPASVRVAVWSSFAWAQGADADTVLQRALPDVDVVLGLSERLALWQDLGERAVYAALPRPGAPGLLPRCPADAFAAAAESQEAVFVAGVGGIAVPRLVSFGVEGDSEGLATRWDPFDAEPVPVHRLAGADVSGADRALRQAVHAAADSLGDGGWVDAWQGQPAPMAEREWSLPSDLPERVRGLLVRAGSILEIAELGLAHAERSTSIHLSGQRHSALRPLRDTAVAALEAATSAAAGYFAAQPRRTSS